MQTEWPSALVALGLIALIGAITVTAIVRYENIDDALKFWSALSGLLGVITGAAVTYFFTRTAVTAATSAASAAQSTANAAQQTAAAANQQAAATQAAVDSIRTAQQ